MNSTQVEWKRHAEGGWGWLLRAYIWLTLRLGRGFGAIILVVICLYYLFIRRFERAASRAFLRRVLAHKPRLRDIARHFWTFSRVTLDRAFLIGCRKPPLEVIPEGVDELQEQLAQGRGLILLGAHFGSFEASRLVSLRRQEVKLRVLMDRSRGTHSNALVERLNPHFAQQVIDVGAGGDRAVMAIKEVLDEGGMVGMLGDRSGPAERQVTVDFLGEPARLPASPYLIAAVTGAPVMLVYGVFEGGRRYRVIFEPFADRVELPRASRGEALQGYAQAYADHLAARVRGNPWNWFNFYDFWRHG